MPTAIARTARVTVARSLWINRSNAQPAISTAATLGTSSVRSARINPATTSVLLTGKSVITSHALANAATGHRRHPNTATPFTPHTRSAAGTSHQLHPVITGMFGGEYSADSRAGQKSNRSHSSETPSIVRCRVVTDDVAHTTCGNSPFTPLSAAARAAR